MKKIYLFAFIAVLILVSILGFLTLGRSQRDREQEVLLGGESTPSQSLALESQTNSEGAVTITVTPKNLSDGTWDFEIALDTHSEELSVDLAAVAILVDDQGKEYSALAWEGDPPGGHHRVGVLSFAPITTQSRSVMLIIRQLGGVQERSFVW